MISEVISKPMYRILSDLTQESRVDVALNLAVKDLLRLKMLEAKRQQDIFSQRYGMDWEVFKQTWTANKIAEKHSYAVESDFWEWEAAESDSIRLQMMLDSIP